jgi:hypothetical protein
MPHGRPTPGTVKLYGPDGKLFKEVRVEPAEAEHDPP